MFSVVRFVAIFFFRNFVHTVYAGIWYVHRKALAVPTARVATFVAHATNSTIDSAINSTINGSPNSTIQVRHPFLFLILFTRGATVALCRTKALNLRTKRNRNPDDQSHGLTRATEDVHHFPSEGGCFFLSCRRRHM